MPLMKYERKQSHAWRVRLNLDSKQVDLLSPALFEMAGITETFPKMTIYFSMTNYAMFMVACSKLSKSVDITKLDMQVVDMKKEPEIVHSRFDQPRPIHKLKLSEE